MDLKVVLELLIKRQKNIELAEGLKEILVDVDYLTPERVAEKIHNRYFQREVESWDEGIAWYKKLNDIK